MEFKRIVCLLITCSYLLQLMAQEKIGNEFSIDISNNNFPVITNHLKLGTHTNAKGGNLDANSLYFIKNGRPWFPVMGEFHFSRFPKEDWETSILKMKACGINIIATYVFWIYHEEEKGTWNWAGNRDLKYFAQLCAKHNMDLFVRIGPWCHGEVRNGGFPDWLLKEAKTRSNDTAYLGFVKPFYQQIASQLKGLYFKDGGTIIGVQIENEFRFNTPKGLDHILTLKKIAVDAGIDVPYYTATNWPGADIKQVELIPVWGAYPEAPWDKNTTKLPLSNNYLFDSLRRDPNIGNDLLGTVVDTTNYKGYRYPFATAEMGAGIQVTYHRRPVILPEDVLGLAIAKTGAGANLMGYYMFHGGTNAIGKLSTLQESKSTKYPNDYPIINYDFQAPIGEWGDIKASYNCFKLFHSFLNNYGERLATCYTYFPEGKVRNKADSVNLRWTVRAKEGSGFIFINQFQRQLKMQDVSNVQFNIKTKEGTVLQVPEKPFTVPANTQFILPFNLKMDGVDLVYATAQPFYIHQANRKTYFFYADDAITPEFVFDAGNVRFIETKNGSVEKREATYKVSAIKAGLDAVIEVGLTNGKAIRIMVLTHAQALNTWIVDMQGKQQLIISAATCIYEEGRIYLTQTDKTSVPFSVFDNNSKLNCSNVQSVEISKEGLFVTYHLAFKPAGAAITWKLNEALTNTSKQMAVDTARNISYPLYSTRLKPIPSAVYYDISIPPNALTGLSDAFLEIGYRGDTYAIYANGGLVADDFNMGLPMLFPLKRFKQELVSNKISCLITAFPPSSKIYLEESMEEGIEQDGPPSIKHIRFRPQYQSIITGFQR